MYYSVSLCYETFKIVLLIFIVFTAQNLPAMFYLYFILPVYLLWAVFITNKKSTLLATSRLRKNYDKLNFILMLIFYLIGLELLVSTEIIISKKYYIHMCVGIYFFQALAFFKRTVLTVSLIGISAWPYFSRAKISKILQSCWMVNCLVLSIFPLLPTIGSVTSFLLVYVSCLLYLWAYKYRF